MASKGKFKILNDLEVSKPCVTGDFASISEPREKGWFCHECQKAVHDFSKLSKKEILKLVEESGGTFCASILRREDGSIITKEAPSRSLLTSGVFLAGTALLASSAAAEPLPVNPGKVVAPPPVSDSEVATVGQVKAPTATPTPEPTEKPTIVSETLSSEQKSGTITPTHEHTMSRGMVLPPSAQETRGRIAIKKK